MNPHKPVCVVSCPIDTFSGYGHRSRDFVQALFDAKHDEWDIQILPQKWGNTPWGALPQEHGFKHRYINKIEKKPEIWIQITIPSEFQPVGQFNIGVTAGIESTVPPPDFMAGMNRMDLNLVSSNFTKDVFSQIQYNVQDQQGNPVQLKLEKPIKTIMEGLDTKSYFKSPGKSGLLDGIDENFCFLFAGHWLQGDFGEDRKNVGLLIKTFLETFKDKKQQPALVLKTSQMDYSLLDKEEILKKIRHIKDQVKGKLPNIYILHGEFTNEELNKINNDPKIKAFVSFTKGEGFGRPLLEQAITGKPVITTNWSGHTDFIRPEYNILLGGELKNIHKSAANKWLIEQAQWFNVNTEIASKAMEDIFKHYKKYIESSRKQTRYLNDNFSYDNMAKDLKDVLDQVKVVVNTPLEMPKLQLPKLKKVGEDSKVELPKLKLPKLKKVES